MIDAKPILFSGPMVRAILEGRKTMTRRILKPQPEGVSAEGAAFVHAHRRGIAVGDTLWVRENWRAEDSDMDHIPPNRVPRASQIFYEVDGSWGKDVTVGKLRPSIHMPRWASRITLAVSAVKVERLQEISDEDALAEGVAVAVQPIAGWDIDIDGNYWPGGPKRMFKELWQSINAKRAPWDSNPWVVAYTFKPIPG